MRVTAPVRVLTVDDQAMVRTALNAMLRRSPGIEVVGEAADGAAAVERAFALRPDVVLMDVRMPGTTGVEATARLLGDWPHPAVPRPRVLVLTTFDLDEYVHAALRAGASGFLLKNTTADRLTEAVAAVAAGEPTLAPTVARRLIDTYSGLPPGLTSGAAPDTLTERERAVALLVARGLSNARIARELALTEPAVKSTVTRVLTRLGLENRVQIALAVLKGQEP
ncbi:response regulator [Streptomyces sp. NPDC048172]|uniref:response regulator transcription factor n=1 Tax=Streptomyces sp. NPDC048172 TaxID=3365505 RepID=UPI0037199EAC